MYGRYRGCLYSSFGKNTEDSTLGLLLAETLMINNAQKNRSLQCRRKTS